jgi:hypothetical protein
MINYPVMLGQLLVYVSKIKKKYSIKFYILFHLG